MEKHLYSFLEKKACSDCCSISNIVLDALSLTLRRYKKGKMHFRNKSDFLIRSDKEDKIELEILLKSYYKTMLRRLSFAMYRSQAEILRISLEYYLKVIFNQEKYNRIAYFRKSRLDRKQTIPGIILFELFRCFEKRLLMVDSPAVDEVIYLE